MTKRLTPADHRLLAQMLTRSENELLSILSIVRDAQGIKPAHIGVCSEILAKMHALRRLLEQTMVEQEAPNTLEKFLALEAAYFGERHLQGDSAPPA